MIDDLWYKNGVIYCLSVGTYMDANGDGVGDFKGLLRRLDYLDGLGVTAVWLMPFQPSPGKDDGYDVADYYGVDPRYGTLGDFVEFTHGCWQRGIRVIIDLVVNHTSDAHPWFRDARSSPDSPYRDWYVWADNNHLINLLSEDHSEANEKGRHKVLLEAYGYRWYRVGGLDYLLKRRDVDVDASGHAGHPA